MNEWLRQFDRKMVRQKRQILLFFGQPKVPPCEVKLQNISYPFTSQHYIKVSTLEF